MLIGGFTSNGGPARFLRYGSGIRRFMACRRVACGRIRNTNRLQGVKCPLDCRFLLFQLLDNGVQAFHYGSAAALSGRPLGKCLWKRCVKVLPQGQAFREELLPHRRVPVGL